MTDILAMTYMPAALNITVINTARPTIDANCLVCGKINGIRGGIVPRVRGRKATYAMIHSGSIMLFSGQTSMRIGLKNAFNLYEMW